MEHFVAYHSVNAMGYPCEVGPELSFYSRKAGLIKRAVGHTVWVIQGEPGAKSTYFSLIGAYQVDGCRELDDEPGTYEISGPAVELFEPPISLNDVDWFPALKKSQSNFSLGFNRINDESVVNGLMKLQRDAPEQLDEVEWGRTGSEGTKWLVTHLRAERDVGLVFEKRASVLAATGRLACQACGFDFQLTYGAVGAGFCEVHHLDPLGSSGVRDTTLDDLAVLCANCHRVLHRSNPPTSISELICLVDSVRAEPKS